MTGSTAQPDAKLRLLVEDALSSAGRFGHFDAEVTAVADGPLTGDAAHIDIAVEARGDELALADRALADALGDRVTLNLRARANGAGDADIGLAKLETTTATVTFAGKAGPTALDGEAKIAASDLSRFAQLAKRDLRGALTLSAALSGAPSKGSVKAVLSGAVDAPSAGLAAIDGLLGRKLALSGAVETLPGGGVSFEALTINGEFVQARVNGAATQEKADIAAQITLARSPPRRSAPDRARQCRRENFRLAAKARRLARRGHRGWRSQWASHSQAKSSRAGARSSGGSCRRAPRLMERWTDARCADESTRPARERAGRSTPWTSTSAARA